jgi:hypothetical protein
LTIGAHIVVCIEILKAIGVVKENKKCVEAPYQYSVTAPLDQEDERDIEEEDNDDD